MITEKRPTAWQALSWILSLIVTAVAAHEGTKAIDKPPAPIVQARPVETPRTEAKVDASKPQADPSGADRLVEAAKGRPSIIDEFEAATARMIREARERVAKK